MDREGPALDVIKESVRKMKSTKPVLSSQKKRTFYVRVKNLTSTFKNVDPSQDFLPLLVCHN